MLKNFLLIISWLVFSQEIYAKKITIENKESYSVYAKNITLSKKALEKS
jgi:hypothetical protein